jgi:hypothetical protein
LKQYASGEEAAFGEFLHQDGRVLRGSKGEKIIEDVPSLGMILVIQLGMKLDPKEWSGLVLHGLNGTGLVPGAPFKPLRHDLHLIAV